MTVQEIAASHIGYQEGANNNQKFGKWFGLNNQPWCAIVSSKIFFDAGRILEVSPKTKPKGFASCRDWMAYLAKNGQLVPVSQMKMDDLVFFQFDEDGDPDHVGICKSNNMLAKSAFVYEGNTGAGNAGSQSNGDGFYLRKRNHSLIMAVGRPKPAK